ncbi:Rpn family recombination-promoting nuclease/putative transposase [Tunicatimonas pelagia]|uniref:Rpn family recombination-promoting nuclease/putative transposase n=1 Tax=Tunicatimonas pelagia TaxID=931531 RepID=UPI002664F4D2|nr:Rpn family recombination-promoting nuclease/putative transposase [Tunicatimonas pelagia]WKN44105.1 Rpn family recombination-promoting nuclease/putative transposase [Tunicatimonas pelagia]
MERYINPLTDYGFKKLFGTEPNKDLLTDFLNQLLPPHHRIQKLNYAKNEHLGVGLIDRKAIFDIYCEGENGDKFIVEVQKAKQNYFKDRTVYYSTFPIQEQAKQGDWSFRLTAVYTVGILDFVFDDHQNEETILHTIKLKDQDCRTFYEKLTYIYIELPKFKKTEEQLESQFEKWLYVLRYLSQLQDRPKALQERVFQKLFKAAEIAKFNKQERASYEESVKYYRDIKNVVDTSHQEGKEEGKEEERIEVAKRGLAKGYSTEVISDMTGLSTEEIEKLK